MGALDSIWLAQESVDNRRAADRNASKDQHMQPLMGVKVARRWEEAEDIAAFELVAENGAPLPPFTAGAHVEVHMAPGLTRPYSLCNDPSERHRYVIGVLREVESKGGSKAMHERIRSDSSFQISPPRNNFELDERAPYSLLLAGGIGVTPILAMARRLHAIGARFDLHYCTRTRARMAFRPDLFDGPFATSVHPHFDDGPQGQLLDINGTIAGLPAGAHVYVCGPTGFMNAVLSTAEKSLPAPAIHREYFVNQASAPKSGEQPFRVQIESTGAIFEVPPSKSIVAVLAEHGIEIPVSCEQGICGTCVTEVVEGVPDHRDLFLTDEEHAQNRQMTPCCSRARTELLILKI
jgi:vanillate O-demethylase ferredoxin subunit